MELWIPITVAAAFFQNLRSAIQRHLKNEAGTTASTLARFVFAIPFAGLYAGVLLIAGGEALPEINAAFLLYIAVGGVMQILATVGLIIAVSEGNFAVGTALSKTETIQAALVAAIVLAEAATPLTLVGILVSFLGVILLSGMRSLDQTRIARRPFIAGIGSGTLFAVSAVCFRGAALELDALNRFTAAAVTLFFVVCYQTVLMLAWMVPREPQAIVALLRTWRWGLAAGVAGMLASVGWFTAMALHPVAAVRAVGQIELLLSLASSKWAFKEAITRRELLGLALLTGGVLTVILA